MKNRQEQDYSVYQVIKEVCQRYAPSVPWQEHEAFAEIHEQWLRRVANLRRLRLLQAQGTSGITQDKAAPRQQMADAALFVADTTVAFAVKQGDNTLAAQAHITRSQILYGKQHDAVTLCQNVQDVAVAAPLSLALQPFGVKTEKLAELQQAIDDFSDAIPKPRVQMKSRKGVTEQLAEEFAAVTALLTDGLDRLIGQFRKNPPEFVREYENARVRVAKAATLDTGKDGEKPAAKAA